MTGRSLPRDRFRETAMVSQLGNTTLKFYDLQGRLIRERDPLGNETGHRYDAFDREIARTMYWTFLASAFRSIRFGINEAHGRGIAIQLNYLLDHGAFKVEPDGRFSVADTKIAEAVTALTHDIMTLQVEGSYDKAKALITTLGVVRPSVQNVLDRLTAVPVDIEPKFTTQLK